MATRVTALARKVCSANHLISNGARKQLFTVARRNINTSFQGPIPPEPVRQRFSITIVFACVCIGTYIGQHLAKSFAEILEETDIFVPDDDDDD